MSDIPFGWLFEESLLKASKELNGDVHHEFTGPFSVVVMDSGFKYSTSLSDEIRSYCRNIGYNISRIYAFSSFSTDLTRQNSKMKSVSKLYVIKCGEDDFRALYFSGCMIDES